MKISRLLAIAFVFCTADASATEPCVPMKEADFRAHVVDASDVAVDGTIENFSDSTDMTKAWTEIKIIKTFKSAVLSTEITVKNWQAGFPPLYNYKKGDRVLLLLKRSGSEYLLTDSEWNSCVPSVISITPEGSVSPLITLSQWSRGPIPVDAFESSMFAGVKTP